MIKSEKAEKEVLEAYDDFHLKHKDGSISNEEYINSTPTKGSIMNEIH